MVAEPISLPSPFGELGVALSPAELRETAYEIFLACCRASRPLTYVSQAEKLDRSNSSSSASAAPSLQRSLTKVKKALGLNSRKAAELGEVKLPAKKRSFTVGEVVTAQLRVSEQADSRIRRALLRIVAGQLGKRIESVVLPLELLQQLKPSDFSNQIEYQVWQRSNWKVLEAGLIVHPYFPLEQSDPSAKRLLKIIRGAQENPIDTGKYSETMQVVRNLVQPLASRSFDGTFSDTCHWADGVPLNLRLYQLLLESCFDSSDETSIIEEVDEVLELLKKTWVVLGINQLLHRMCFSWVLFHRYVSTGEVGDDLLFAANNLLAEIDQDSRVMKSPVYFESQSSMLRLMLSWAEKKLLNYHHYFHAANADLMQKVLSLAASAAKILEEEILFSEKVETYIRSSLCSAFSKKVEFLEVSISAECNDSSPKLSILASELSKLAFHERDVFSPILSRWHQLPAGLAVATLHLCYGNKLKDYVSGISELALESVNVLVAADKLEKDLVQIAVEDSVESEDGGTSIIREMLPFDTEDVLTRLVTSWIGTRVDRLNEWVERNLQQEVWNPRANKDHFAPSATEVLRFMDDTLEAFFLLPIPMHPVLLPDLMSGLDKSLQHYVVKVKSGCGSKSTYLPTMPSLTRCRRESKIHGVFKKKDKSNVAERKKSQVENVTDQKSLEISQLCVRINTLQHIITESETLSARALTCLRNCETAHVDGGTDKLRKKFDLSAVSCLEGIQQLCEAAAYKVVFHDLPHALTDGLYVGGVQSSRIDPFLLELDHYLKIISTTVHHRVRLRIITDVMKASLDGFLLVLLAGGPSRGFTLQDSAMIEEDFGFLKYLFWSNGDGLPLDLIDKHSTTATGILPLFRADTESLIERFSRLSLKTSGSSVKSQMPLPPTTGYWGPTDINTLLRVLCYRNDVAAIKFLKKAYSLPKKL